MRVVFVVKPTLMVVRVVAVRLPYLGSPQDLRVRRRSGGHVTTSSRGVVWVITTSPRGMVWVNQRLIVMVFSICRNAFRRGVHSWRSILSIHRNSDGRELGRPVFHAGHLRRVGVSLNSPGLRRGFQLGREQRRELAISSRLVILNSRGGLFRPSVLWKAHGGECEFLRDTRSS